MLFGPLASESQVSQRASVHACSLIIDSGRYPFFGWDGGMIVFLAYKVLGIYSRSEYGLGHAR